MSLGNSAIHFNRSEPLLQPLCVTKDRKIAMNMSNSIMRSINKAIVRALKSRLDDKLIVPRELEMINSYSVSGLFVLNKLFNLGRYVVNHNIPGDFVECGVYNGGSAAAIALALGHSGKKIWLYDSFQGLPDTREEKDGIFASNYVGKCLGSEENVKKALEIVGCNENKYVIKRGWFESTFKDQLPNEIALLHIDADWYDSVKLSLETFYERVAEGGVIVLDDFGCWEGCREAFYDFAEERKIKPLLERFGFSQAYWIKGKTHNRGFQGKKEMSLLE